MITPTKPLLNTLTREELEELINQDKHFSKYNYQNRSSYKRLLKFYENYVPTIYTQFKNHTKQMEINHENFTKKNKKVVSYLIYQLSGMYQLKEKSYYKKNRINSNGIYKQKSEGVLKRPINLCTFNNNMNYESNNKRNEKLVYEDEHNTHLKTMIKVRNNKYISNASYMGDMNKSKESLFITTTPITEFIYYKKLNPLDKTCDKMVKNRNCSKKYGNYSVASKAGLKYLNKFWRTLRKDIHTYLKRKGIDTQIDFIKILEPQKNLTPHNHMLLYVDKDQMEVVKEVFEMLVKRFKMTQSDIVEIEAGSGSNYITKYLKKNLLEENEFFNEFISEIGGRVFTSSNYRHTTQKEIDITYNWLKNNKPKLFARWNKKVEEQDEQESNEDYIVRCNKRVSLYVNLEKYILKYMDSEYEYKKVLVDNMSEINKNIKNEIEDISDTLKMFDLPFETIKKDFIIEKNMLIYESKIIKLKRLIKMTHKRSKEIVFERLPYITTTHSEEDIFHLSNKFKSYNDIKLENLGYEVIPSHSAFDYETNTYSWESYDYMGDETKIYNYRKPNKTNKNLKKLIMELSKNNN